MTTAETVTTCIAKIMGIAADTITAETTLESLGIDSLDQIEIAMDIEAALGIALPDDGIVGETVGDVIGMVEGVVAA